MSIDPVTTDANTGNSFNRYGYANNSPYKYIDPDGRLPIVPILVFVAKEVAGEAFERTTGLPALTVKGVGKSAVKTIVKTTKELRGGNFRKSKAEAIKNAGGKCEYCSKNDATQGDHAKTLNSYKDDVNEGKISASQAKQEANGPDNIVAACKDCNEGLKHTKDLGKGEGQFDPPNPSPRVEEMMRSNDGK